MIMMMIDHADNKGKQKTYYRKFLINLSSFHQIFTYMDSEVVTKIHFNYRLTYLKESVMAYYLFMEDPTYNFINNIITQNNQYIIENLLCKQPEPFINFLIQFNNNILLSCKFLNEFYVTFRQFFSIPEIKDALLLSIKKSNFLTVIQDSLQKVLQQNNQSEEQFQSTQFIVQTLLQFQMMIMNADAVGFLDFLFQNTTSLHQFLNNLYLIVFSPQSATHILLIDLMILIFPPPQYVQNQITNSHQAHTLLPQIITFLKRCAQQPLGPLQAQTLGSIIQNIVLFYHEVTPDILQLTIPILQLMTNPTKNPNQQQKTQLISAFKLFKFLLSQNQLEVDKFLKDNKYADAIIQYSITRKQEGIIQGQLREIIKTLKINNTVGQYVVNYYYYYIQFKCQLVMHDETLKNSSLFEPLLKEFQYVNNGQSIAVYMPPESPSHSHKANNNIQKELIAEEKYFEDDEELIPEEELPEAPQRKLINVRERKKVEVDEDDSFQPKRKPTQTISFDLESINKKIKPNE